MCLLRYRRLPDDEYRIRFGDADGQVLPLFWLGGCVLSLWVSLIAGVIVALVAFDLVSGLVVGLGGAVLGVVTTTALAVGLPEIDASWLRLGPVAVLIELSSMFAGAVAVIALALAVLLCGATEVSDIAHVPAAAARPGAGVDLFDLARRAFALLFIVSLVATVVRHLLGRASGRRR